jgi:ubiquinone biosynthesis protein
MITKSQRYREILTVLARNGIAIVDDELVKHESGDQARAEHLRRACEELGTMFVKLGQMLSTRGDLLPDAYRAELAKLQDEVAPVPASAIAGVIREDLGAPPEKLFAFFDPEPLGSGSIGQVHAARLFGGRDVVVKVRKPGVDDLCESTSTFWPASLTNGLRVFRYLRSTTRAAYYETLQTFCWQSSITAARRRM